MQSGAEPKPNDARWRAVLRRDARSDGAFVYAVRSTGVYCRPTCPSRRPRRDQVAFFEAPAAAEAAGFRSCRRCRPREPREAWVRRACALIEASEAPPRLSDLGRAVGLSPFHVQRAFKRALGVTPRQYAAARRLAAFKRHLKRGGDVTTALYEAGYGSGSRLYEVAGRALGMTPASYGRGGAGARIGFTTIASPLGRVLLAATERGVCAVKVGDRDGDLAQALRAEFPAAALRRDDGLRSWAAHLLAHVERGTAIDLPLDVRVTAFQSRVLEALRAIPRGQTRSYAEVARAIGSPAAARAVGRACASNPVALLVPCHRVVGSDGSLTGYRWGSARKQALLETERGR